MKIFIENDKQVADKKAFEIIKKQVLIKPSSLIGLAVGKTTDNLYKLISKDAKKNPRFWKRIKIFQIDENLGISPSSSLSFNSELRKELKELIKVLPQKNIFLINGRKTPEVIIKETYKFIKKNKGIDLIALGLGPKYDPHIAYNTTGKSSINSRMRVVDLHPKTAIKIKSQLQIKGITLGIKDILECKKALLIAYGKDKAKSLKLALSKVDMKKSSASALLLHKDLHVVVDRDAAKHLNVKLL